MNKKNCEVFFFWNKTEQFPQDDKCLCVSMQIESTMLTSNSLVIVMPSSFTSLSLVYDIPPGQFSAQRPDYYQGKPWSSRFDFR